jgi:hypothetical protein
MRSAALPAALGMLLFASGASAEEQNAPATDEAALPPLPENLARVPAPEVAPPVNRKKPELVHVTLEAKPVTGSSPMAWATNIGPIMALCLAR